MLPPHYLQVSMDKSLGHIWHCLATQLPQKEKETATARKSTAMRSRCFLFSPRPAQSRTKVAVAARHNRQLHSATVTAGEEEAMHPGAD